MTEPAMKALQNRIIDGGIPTCYIGDLPLHDIECVAIRPVDGYPSTMYLGMPETLEPLVEVLVRAYDYATGQQWYNSVYQSINKFGDESVGLLNCVVTGSPGYLGRNYNGFGEWHLIAHLTLATSD